MGASISDRLFSDTKIYFLSTQLKGLRPMRNHNRGERSLHPYEEHLLMQEEELAHTGRKLSVESLVVG